MEHEKVRKPGQKRTKREIERAMGKKLWIELQGRENKKNEHGIKSNRG